MVRPYELPFCVPAGSPDEVPRVHTARRGSWVLLWSRRWPARPPVRDGHVDLHVVVGDEAERVIGRQTNW